MKPRLISLFAGSLSLVGASNVQAQGLASGWSGSAGLSAIFTDGNTETRNIAGNLNVAKQSGLWRHSGFASLFNAESNDVDNGDRVEVGYKLDRNLNRLTYIFGRLRYDYDDFSNIDSRFSGAVGLGRILIRTPKIYFNAEVGIGI